LFVGSIKPQRVDELTTRIDVKIFSIVLCLSSNTISSVGWYVDNGSLRYMTYDIKVSNMFQEQEGVICVELGGDATYHVKGLGSIYFHKPLGDAIELYHIFYILDLTKILFSIYCITFTVFC
jgi:hypothetical protein